ncbi:hypothetical protein [Sphingomonas immobilis]|uniref:Uncharacterized protein n=1 Tax=Sphingomonas immobilis TaxID=3063997 RepID=A0ABT8ZW40_9SPHN|nr:hypothetical protein [Sphingomonas sp. CA1-15]MDO7841783.1 hypothetical protein [Sphingomonas sp. CA1-15]
MTEFIDQVWANLAQRPDVEYDNLSDMSGRGVQSQEVLEAMMRAGEDIKRRRPARRTAVIMGDAARPTLTQRQVNRTVEKVLVESRQFVAEPEALAWLLQE